jgi:hypothetical protein
LSVNVQFDPKQSNQSMSNHRNQSQDFNEYVQFKHLSSVIHINHKIYKWNDSIVTGGGPNGLAQQ